MAQEIIRIGIFWYPPNDLKNLLERTWSGELNDYKACELISRHCGDCPVWGAHATLLDAITIIADQRDEFINAMNDILKKYLPIELHGPKVKNWRNNSFIRKWNNKNELKRFESLRRELMERAKDFFIVEQVSWEAINQLDHIVTLLGEEVSTKFIKGLEKLKDIIAHKSLKLVHTPNIPLDWYVKRPDRYTQI